MKEHRDAISTRSILRARGPWAMMFLALAATGCGSGETSTGGGGSGGGKGQGGGGGTPEPNVPLCYRPCSAAADCPIPQSPPLYDEDNYACEDSLCVHRGCNNDEECEDTLGPLYGCGSLAGSKLKTCNMKCATVDDCALSGAPSLFDEDNYACEGSFCVYKGCNDDQECIEFLGDDHRCRALPGAATKSCNRQCAAAGDCVLSGSPPLYDDDNWACEDSVCVHTGCNGDQECSLQGPGYICAEAP